MAAYLLLVGTCVGALTAQVQTELFEGRTGTDLQEALDDAYSPTRALDYGVARDTLFAVVFRRNAKLACQYTGFEVDLPDGVDPSTFAFDQGINTEHLYPRSKGAGTGNALADMHHLYPTREGVNADRASLPFAEIDDARAQRWYYLDQQRSSPPAVSVRDAWSEQTGQAFEPRESVKGDVARAVFYFYTMYRGNAVAADPDFFGEQVATLCDWHAADPVDADEYARTLAIERSQGNANPFVLDCTLPDRTGYCPQRSSACQAVDVRTPAAERAMRVFPNPTRGTAVVTGLRGGDVLALVDVTGRVRHTTEAPGGTLTLELPADLPAGLYTLVELRSGSTRRLILERL